MILNNFVIGIVNSTCPPNWGADQFGNPVIAVECDSSIYIGMHYSDGIFSEYVPTYMTSTPIDNYQPTEGELIIMEAQAATLINQQEIISKQTEIDMTLAELLLNQQGVSR